MLSLYRAQAACRVARISARTLDYWVTTGLVRPASVYRGPQQRRDFFLFGVRELIQLRVISALRRTGLSLQRIRDAVQALEARTELEWEKSCLIADSKRAYLIHDSGTLEALSGDQRGQLAFAVVALGPAEREVLERLARGDIKPFPSSHHRGQVIPFRSVA